MGVEKVKLVTILMLFGYVGVAGANNLTDKLIKEKQWADAAIALKDEYKESGENWKVALKYAEVLTRLKRREEGLRLLKAKIEDLKGVRQNKEYEDLVRRMKVIARTFFTNDASQLFEEGLNFMRDREFLRARDEFEKALKKERKNVEILVRLSQVEMMLNNVDSATEYLKRAQDLCPFEGEVLLWLGRAYFRRGQVKSSIETLREAYAMLPRSELAPVWLADSLILRRKKRDAIKVLKKDLDAEPFHILSLIRLSEIYRDSSDDKSRNESLKNLQIAMSRIDNYKKIDLDQQFESDLGYSPHKATEVETSLKALFQQASST